MIEKLLLTRAGWIQIGPVFGDDRNQCGSVGERRIRYHVAIVGNPSNLNPKGFVLDNNEVQRYFDEKYSKVEGDLPSCELMAMEACEDLASRSGCPVRVEVTVGGNPEAGLTAFWTPENGVGRGCLFPRVPRDGPAGDRPFPLHSEEVLDRAGEAVIDVLDGQTAAESVARIHGPWPTDQFHLKALLGLGTGIVAIHLIHALIMGLVMVAPLVARLF